MGLRDGKCDSCEEKFDVLFPVGVLDELPTGGLAMVQRWYCKTCKDSLEDEAELMEEEKDKDDEEDKKDDEKDEDSDPVQPLPPQDPEGNLRQFRITGSNGNITWTIIRSTS